MQILMDVTKGQCLPSIFIKFFKKNKGDKHTKELELYLRTYRGNNSACTRRGKMCQGSFPFRIRMDAVQFIFNLNSTLGDYA